ncbi:CopG family transcriptional regulator [Oscillospiraceae bacterium 21-37]|jgi:metal-responsive CopG/Arc/MetJ family transcriptional regulator|uniref:CopG family transcriptional regulator n=1 Tax=Eubacteriales TaxID=186802 RepID=UPI00136EEE47|nr:MULTISPECIES: CopG family transcriptional regulator [unclassified Neglectibacter]MCI8922224.1 CopG family transcriptional regulator [Acutalibacter sp.]MCI9115186.1 CopG family transcriptional regulator [Acutalibacter sp.]NBI18141.1 CopG family transcriptional regulator [Neglectibacter sp. 59]NBJ73846.1 CopG family transcriptional regulator [Neglectibacter sp. X4]NCE81539.1 CopG family transcriptional regulator [Neglectibacter sp. X58]
MGNRDLIIKPKKAKGEDGYKVFSIRIREELVSRLDTISAQSGHSRNELIGIFIEFALNRCHIEESGKK